MLNFLPQFIYDKYSANTYSGNIEAITMFMDISGFTPMTEKLMKEGKEGAEVLSSILNSLFKLIIDAVYNAGGFVSGFAGDAFTAIFPGHHFINALYSAKIINELFINKGLQKTRFGDFQLYVKLGLSYGDVKWGIAGEEDIKTFYFKGEAIDGCAYSEHHSEKMDIIIDKRFIDNLPSKENIEFESIDTAEEYYKVKKVDITDNNLEPFVIKEKNNDILKKFIPDKVLNYTGTGELRDIVSIFISFKEFRDYEKLHEFISKVLEISRLYGGYIKGIDFGDKGGTILVIFGAPISYEDNVERALNFVLDVKDNFRRKIRAGITQGTVYAGIIGSPKRCVYDVLGDTVNLSARLMIEAKWGKIWLSDDVAHVAKGKFQMDLIGSVSFKGKLGTVNVFELLSKREGHVEKFYRGKMFGREKELDFFRECLSPLYERKFAGILYLYGEAGAGKSRFLYEINQNLEDASDLSKVKTCIMNTDNILNSSMLPFIGFFNQYFNQTDCRNTKEKEENFEDTFDEFLELLEDIDDDRIDETIEELERTICFIKALVGIYQEGSLYDELDAKGRFENTIIAIKEFFKSLSLINPIIIQIEDIQWLDNDSEEVISNMLNNIEEYPFMIVASSRYYDDGSKPVLSYQNTGIQAREIIFSPLGDKSVQGIIKNWLGYNADSDLLNFIISRSNKNPLYIEQFCLYILENESVELLNNKYSLKSDTKGIPKEINSLLISRIDRLEVKLKELVLLSSVIGKDFDVAILTRTINILEDIFNNIEVAEENDLNKNIFSTVIKENEVPALLESGINQVLWIQISETLYTFSNLLIKEIAYDIQLRSRIRYLHKIVGESIEELFGDNKDLIKSYYSLLAYHYEKAEIFDKSIKYYEKAGDYAINNYSNSEAIYIYDKLIELVKDKTKLIGYYKKDVQILELTCSWDKAIEKLNNGLDITIERHDRVSEAFFISYLGWIHFRMGNYEKALDSISQSIQISKDIDADVVYAESLNRKGVIFHNKSQYDEALNLYQEAYKIFEKLDNKKGISDCLHSMGLINFNRGNYQEAIDLFNRSLSIKEELNDKRGIASSYHSIGVVNFYQGNFKESIQSLKSAYDIRTTIGDRIGITNTLMLLGIVHSNEGKHDSALEYYHLSLNIGKELGNRQLVASTNQNIGQIESIKGEYDKALEHYKNAMNIFEDISDKRNLSITYCSIGIVNFQNSDYDKALEYYYKSLDIQKEIGAKGLFGYNYSYMVNTFVRLGKPKEAIETAILSLNNIKGIGTDVEHGKTYLGIALLLSQFDLDEQLDVLFSKITDITGFDKKPEPYFEQAINISLKTNYLETLLPALYEYSKYLVKSGKKEYGIEKIKLAKEKANESKLDKELKEIEMLAKELNIIL